MVSNFWLCKTLFHHNVLFLFSVNNVNYSVTTQLLQILCSDDASAKASLRQYSHTLVQKPNENHNLQFSTVGYVKTK